MSVGRFVGGLAASLAVAGCATLAIGMSRSPGASPADGAAPSLGMPSTYSARPTFAPLPTTTAASTPAAPTSAARISIATTSAAAPTTTAVRRAAAPDPTPIPTSGAPAPPARSSNAPAPRATSTSPRTAAAQNGVALPLRFGTGSATKVITVTASSKGSTVATLQAWTKASGGGWRRYGTAVRAHIGAQGMTAHPSESKSATPIGSFTLTRAFGHYSNPGTGLSYFKTRPSDWWISQSGPLYNTHQRCASNCPFTRGAPNEHLYYETPYYNYAVVIDYNTRNAPGGVRQGAGSAFFLHVTDGAPTAGCVAIGQAKLVSLMRWLTPTSHPRILIGTV